MFGRTERGATLAVVNTNQDRAVELSLSGNIPELSNLSLYAYGNGLLKLDGDKLLPAQRELTLTAESRIRLAPETMLVYTSLE